MNNNFTENISENQVLLLAEMLEQSAEAIFARDENQNIVFWNWGAENLFGYSKQEAIGKTVEKLQFTKLSSEEILDTESQINQNKFWKSERTYYHKNGTSFWGSVTGNKISSNQNEKEYFYFIIKDISKHAKLHANLQKNNEELAMLLKFKTEELRKTEEYYRPLFEKNPMPMWVIDLNTFKFLDVNESAIAQYGYNKTEFLNMTALDIREQSDKEKFINLHRGFENNSKTVNRGIWKHTIKNGSVIHVEITAQSLLFKGIPSRLILANNITDKIIAEEKNAASEKRFKSLIENSYDVFSMINEKHNIIYRSPSAARMTGWSDEEIIKSEGINFIHPDDKNYLQNINIDLFKNPGKPYHIQYRMLHKNGHYIDVEGTITNFLNDKSINAIVINFHEITEQKKAEKKLIANERRFRSLIENSHDVFTMFDESFNIIFRSQSAERITGWSNEEMLSANAVKNIHPDDLENVLEIFKEVKNQKGENIKLEFRNKHKNGHYIYVEGYIINLLDDENVNAFVINYHDVTERKIAEKALVANEKRFRSLIENSNDLFTMFDEHFNIIYRSQSAERITGWKNDEMLHVNGTQNIHPDDLANCIAIINDIKANPGKNVRVAFRNKHKNGYYIHVEGYIINLLEDENVKAIVINFQDITEIKNAELEREKMISEIIKRSKRLEQFTYIISHNLRLPVANILGIADVLQKNILEEERETLVKFLSTATLQLDEVIKDLNTILQIQSQITEYNEIVSMSKLISDIESSIKILVNNARVTIELDFTAIDNITTIKSYLYSIFYNLITNSIKYRNPDRPLIITIKSTKEDKQIKIHIKDNGLGFDFAQNEEKIFGLYKRFHPQIEGKGIGLFLVKTQVESLNGTINVYSKPNQGAEFILDFPIE